MQSARPMWLYSSITIRIEELKKFIYKKKYNFDYSYSFATPSLNAMLSDGWPQLKIMPMSAEVIIEQFIKHPRFMRPIRSTRDNIVKSIAVLKGKKEKSNKNLY